MFISQYFRTISIIFLSLFLISCGGGNTEEPKVVAPPKATLSGTPDLTVNENENYSFTVTNQNFNNNSLNYSIENLPSWANLDTATGQLSGTPNFEQAGVYSNILITASDGTNAAVLPTFSIEVINVNRLPVVTAQVEYEVLESELISIALDISDPDLDNLSVTLENEPAWLSFDAESSSLVGKASLNDSGSYQINIIVNDGSDELSVPVSLIVKDALEVRGKVIDGYISGAIVYLDENINVILDENEFSTITDETGSYTLLLPAEKLDLLSKSPIRAFIGAGAQDLSRPALDFTNTPLTLSLPPIDINKIENDIIIGAIVSPFSEQLMALVSDKLLLIGSGELSVEELKFYIENAKKVITKGVISAGEITLDSSQSEDSISEIIFGDFVEGANDLTTIIEQAENYVDLIMSLHESADFDGDGIANNADTDDDGDGHDDNIDDFPFDATKWLDIDTDGDGVDDSADFYPNNAKCFAVEDGNGEECYLNIIADNTSRFISVSSAGTAYFYQEDGMLITFDVNTRHVVNVQQVENVRSMLFHEGHQRLYIGFGGGQVKYLTEEYLLTDFLAGETTCGSRLVDADSFLILVCNGYTTFNRNGEQLGQALVVHGDYDEIFSDRIVSYANPWNSVNNRLYHHYEEHLSHYYYVYASYSTITATGEFISPNFTVVIDEDLDYDSGYHRGLRGPIVISNDGTKVLSGRRIYDANSLSFLTSIDEDFSQAFWLNDGSLITLHQADNQEDITLKRRDSDLNVVEIRDFTGSLQAVKVLADSTLFILKDGGSLNFIDYLPSDDSDNDGVVNTLDAFPLDNSASIDTDQDGFPDSWNTGFIESLNNLTLDEFPLDSACWLASHGNENGCDFLATQPIFTPDKIVYDDVGTIYFLSSVNKRIYRWSSASNQFTNPIVIDSSIYHDFGESLRLTYSSVHNRLYLLYSSGAITRFNLDELKEKWFANVGPSTREVFDGFKYFGSVGNFLITAKEYSEAKTGKYYILNKEGVITDNKYWSPFYDTYAWNKHDSRLYYVQRGGIKYQTIDQTLGQITETGSIQGELSSGGGIGVSISSDGVYALRGNGDIVNLINEELSASLALESTDIIATSDTIVAVENNNNASTLKFWQLDDFSSRGSITLAGTPLALTPNGDDINLVSQLSDGSLAITAIGIVDADGDGLPRWWESLYHLDDNNASDAALDSDEDGLTHLEEFQHSTDPTNADSDNDGLNDFDEVNLYLSNPLNADSDNDEMPDAWEVANNLDLLNGDDALLDADNDGFTNIDEYFEKTDPHDENSIPDIIETLTISFEDAVVPTDWVIDETLESSWSISQLESSAGDYSLFSSGLSAIAFSGYFNGNDLAFDVKGACQYGGYIRVYIDDILSKNFSFNESWQTVELVITKGVHTVSFEVSRCGIYLDNLRFTPLLSLNELSVQTVTYTDKKLHFYDAEQQLVKSINVPINSDSRYVRDLTVLDDGRIAIISYSQSSRLSIYNPAHGTWQHKSEGYLYGLTHLNNYLFVVNEYSSGGIVRLNLDNNVEQVFSGVGYTDLTIGEDGMLYALSSIHDNKSHWTFYRVHKYEPESMTLLTNFLVNESYYNVNAIAVDASSNVFIATDGVIARYDAEGVERQQLIVSDFYDLNYLYDIDLTSPYGLIVTGDSGKIFKVDGEFSSITLQDEHFKGKYIAQVLLVDNDSDGLPSWWEVKFGLNDNDENDALTDLDNDGLSNLEEFQASTLPNDEDSDDDGLTDVEEVNGFYSTNPTNPDTDNDGLTDGSELYEHLTNPLLADTDGDFFDDVDEINIYQSDPNDIDSTPDTISQIDIPFDSAIIPSDWFHADTSNAQWFIENSAEAGEADNYTLRSGDIGDWQKSAIVWKNLFTQGTLSLDVKVSSELCCDYFYLYVDGIQTVSSNSAVWETLTIELSQGLHFIEFRYYKDRYVSDGEDAVWIDNITFESN